MTKKPKNSTTNFFGKRGYLTRPEFREKLRKASPFTPGFGGMIKERERIKLEKKLFSKKYGHFVEKKDYSKVLDDLRKEKYSAKTYQKKREIERDINFLKRLGNL